MGDEKRMRNTRHKGNVEYTRRAIDKSEKEGEYEEGKAVPTAHPWPHLVPGEREQEECKQTNREDEVN